MESGNDLSREEELFYLDCLETNIFFLRDKLLYALSLRNAAEEYWFWLKEFLVGNLSKGEFEQRVYPVLEEKIRFLHHQFLQGLLVNAHSQTPNDLQSLNPSNLHSFSLLENSSPFLSKNYEEVSSRVPPPESQPPLLEDFPSLSPQLCSPLFFSGKSSGRLASDLGDLPSFADIKTRLQLAARSYGQEMHTTDEAVAALINGLHVHLKNILQMVLLMTPSLSLKSCLNSPTNLSEPPGQQINSNVELNKLTSDNQACGQRKRFRSAAHDSTQLDSERSSPPEASVHVSGSFQSASEPLDQGSSSTDRSNCRVRPSAQPHLYASITKQKKPSAKADFGKQMDAKTAHVCRFTEIKLNAADSQVPSSNKHQEADSPVAAVSLRQTSIGKASLLGTLSFVPQMGLTRAKTLER